MARLQTLKPRVKTLAGRGAKPVEATTRTSRHKMYGYRWQQARQRFLDRRPLCVMCASEGLVTVATDVDHIVAHKGDEALFWDESNWQPLCKSHHSQKTAREDGGFGRAPVSG